MTRVDGTHADWLFNQNVTVSGATLQLKVNGNSAASSVQQGPATIRNNYSAVFVSAPWTLPASEPNVTPTPAFPESGTVV